MKPNDVEVKTWRIQKVSHGRTDHGNEAVRVTVGSDCEEAIISFIVSGETGRKRLGELLYLTGAESNDKLVGKRLRVALDRNLVCGIAHLFVDYFVPLYGTKHVVCRSEEEFWRFIVMRRGND